MRAVFDALRGEALIGNLQIRIADAGPNGELRVGGESGPILRPISFGQRQQIAARAVPALQPVDAVAAGVLQAATVETGSAEPALLEIIALALAGADQPGTSFAETAQQLTRATGWQLMEILDAPAAEVDRLAHSLAPSADDGWTRIQFGSTDPSDEALAIRKEYAENLLQRVAEPQSLPASVEPEQAVQWPGSQVESQLEADLSSGAPSQGEQVRKAPLATKKTPRERLETEGVAVDYALPERRQVEFSYRLKLSPNAVDLAAAHNQPGRAQLAPQRQETGATHWESNPAPSSENDPAVVKSSAVAARISALADMARQTHAPARGNTEGGAASTPSQATSTTSTAASLAGFEELYTPGAPNWFEAPIGVTRTADTRFRTHSEANESTIDAFDLARRLAVLLDEESDLRGLDQ